MSELTMKVRQHMKGRSPQRWRSDRFLPHLYSWLSSRRSSRLSSVPPSRLRYCASSSSSSRVWDMEALATS